MGATVHPHSLASGGSAAAVLRACASSSSILINPACVAKPAAAVAKPKRTGSFHEGDSPAKRARGACGEVQPDTATTIKTRPRPGSDGDRCPAGSVRTSMEALCVTMNQASASPIPLPGVAAAAPPKHPACSMSELLEKARLAKARSAAPAVADADAEAVCRREIERRRAEARREIEQVVRTVEFNDPFIDPQDVFK